MGGMVRWLIDRAAVARGERPESEDSGPGVLFSSGLIAGGAIVGVGIAALQALRKDEFLTVTHWFGAGATSITESAIVAMAMYVLLLALPLYRVARRRDA
jgi:TPP-dependent pyruvate/acetoin dehydrogenase alpha subunit